MVEVTSVDDEAPTNPQLLSRQDDGQAERVGLESSRGASSILNPQTPTADTVMDDIFFSSGQIDAQVRQIFGDSVERMSFDSQTFDESLSTIFDLQPPTPTATTSNSQFSAGTHSLFEGLISTARDRQLLEPTFGFPGLFSDSQTSDQSLSMVFDPRPAPIPTASTSNSQTSTSTHSLFEGLISTARDRQLLEPTFGFPGLFSDSQSMVFDPRPAPIPTASTSNSQTSTSTHSLSEGLILTARQLLEPTFGFECLSFDSQTFNESLSTIFDLQPPTPTATTSNSQFSTSTHSLSEGLISTARDRQLLEPTFGFPGLFLDSQTSDQSLSMVFDPRSQPFPMASTSNPQSSTSTHSLSEGLIPTARQLLEPTFGFECLSFDSQSFDESLSTIFDLLPPPTPTASTSNSQFSTSSQSLSEGLIPTATEVRQALLPMTGLESLQDESAILNSQEPDQSR